MLSAGIIIAPKPNRITKGATLVIRPGTIDPKAPRTVAADWRAAAAVAVRLAACCLAEAASDDDDPAADDEPGELDAGEELDEDPHWQVEIATASSSNSIRHMLFALPRRYNRLGLRRTKPIRP